MTLANVVEGDTKDSMVRAFADPRSTQKTLLDATFA